MAKRDRGTLKRFFAKGTLPSAEHFADFIDSSINIRDDGISKTPQDGLQLSSRDDKDSLLSLYHRIDFDEPLWALKYNDKANDNLDLVSMPNSDSKLSILSFSPKGFIGINNQDPTSTLDINGTLSAEEQRGKEKLAVLADGNWYDVTSGLRGAQCFELVAAVGIPNTLMQSMMKVNAMGIFEKTSSSFWRYLRHLFSRKKHFSIQHMYYSHASHRMRVRWLKKPDGLYYLQLATRCDFNHFATQNKNEAISPIRIRYHITSLWQDPLLSSCKQLLSAKQKEALGISDDKQASQGKSS